MGAPAPPAELLLCRGVLPLPRGPLQPHLDQRAHGGAAHRHARRHAGSGRPRPEVGDVLSHYGVAGHTVVDKYEAAPGVHNLDILDFEDPEGFDLIVSISTLEHTGFEEEIPDPGKPGRVADHLAALLRPAGQAIVTFPLGYNPSLDELVATQPDAFGQMRGLRRISADNRWREKPVSELLGARYGEPHLSANALVVASIADRPSPAG